MEQALEWINPLAKRLVEVGMEQDNDGNYYVVFQSGF